MQALIPHDGTVQLGTVEEPELSADEALIAVEAFSINRGETYQLDIGGGTESARHKRVN